MVPGTNLKVKIKVQKKNSSLQILLKFKQIALFSNIMYIVISIQSSLKKGIVFHKTEIKSINGITSYDRKGECWFSETYTKRCSASDSKDHWQLVAMGISNEGETR